ncbi:MAG: hypothetical protein LBE60_12160 [Microbacterium sp.]|uniref:hypothetical protein n=1 Tax=Microbacterium sp. TaxID=51671 RepID=UPI00282242A6|nr:hypothetical protein [Microbacterium sp.]MDR2322388.1 hypothetical protein [Microbacterium sp.]
MKFLTVVAWVVILVIRGIALWLLIPLALLAWLVVHAWVNDASPGRVIAWYDLNLIAALTNGPFRVLIPAVDRPRFIGLTEFATTSRHRVRLNDLWTDDLC